jgi:hypothetical protein
VSPLQAAKLWAVENVGLAKDALHVHVGLALFLGSAALFRWKLSSWRPWLAVAVAVAIGELWDLRDSFVHDTPIRLAANWQDIWNTLLWPTVLLLLARWTRVLRR